jgi:ABC-2 type transport system permease protein
MNRFWIVASYEFFTNVKKKSFLFTLFGLPIFMGIIFTVVTVVTTIAIGSGEVREDAIGYVDEIGVLAEAKDLPEGWQAYPTVAAAEEAVTAGTIDAYFVYNQAFQRGANLDLYAEGTVGDPIKDAIEGFITTNLAANTDSALPTERLENPVQMNIFLTSTGRALSQVGFIVLLFIPIIFMIIFMMGMQIGSSFLMSGIVEEKSNRVIELLVTTVTPYQLLGGKIIGLGALALLQLVVWLGIGVVAFLISRNLESLRGFVMPWDVIAMACIYFVLTYFFYGALLTGIGVLVDGEQESRQYAGIISFGLVIPIFFLGQFLENSNGTIPVILSYVPFTSGLAMSIRAAFGAVGIGEIALSLGIMLASTVIVIWVSAKVFKWGLLMYGKKASLRELWRVVRGNPEMGGVA